MNFMYFNINFDAETREFNEIKKETDIVENIIIRKIYSLLISFCFFIISDLEIFLKESNCQWLSFLSA